MRMLVVVTMAGLLSMACGLSVGPQARPDITYYHLSIPAPEPVAEPLPIDVAVAPFAQDSVLDRDGIIYKKSDVEGGFWLNHRWAQSVESMVRGAVQRDLRESEQFRRVVLIDESGYADVLIVGEVLRFDEQDQGDGWFAVVEIGFDVIRQNVDGSGDRIVLSRRYRREERAAENSVPEVVRALSRATGQVLVEFRADLMEVLR